MAIRTYPELGVLAQQVADETAPGANTADRVGNLFQDFIDSGVRTVKVSLSSAELLAGNTTPKVAVAAQGAGLAIRPIAVMWNMNFNTAAYATNTTVALKYNTLSGNLASVSSLLAVTSDTVATSLPSTGLTFVGTTPANKSLVIEVSTGDPITGDGTLDVFISYVVYNLA